MGNYTQETAPTWLTEAKGTSLAREIFEFEKQQLPRILDAAWQARSAADWGPHPIFGTMTVKEWGKLLQIHIDYHLRQFAA